MESSMWLDGERLPGGGGRCRWEEEVEKMQWRAGLGTMLTREE